MNNKDDLYDKIKDTIYHIFLGIEDGWAYPHHTNYNDNLYIRVMNVAQVTRLAYEVYKSLGKISHKEVNPFSVKPDSNPNNWHSVNFHNSFFGLPENKN